MLRHIDLRFRAQEDARSANHEQVQHRLDKLEESAKLEAGEWQRVEREFLQMQRDMALQYVRREDYIRGQSVVEAKLDGLAVKIETCSCGEYWMERKMQIDLARSRRESLRWLILLTLNNARPIGAFEGPILSVAQSEYPDATPLELRRELDYLSDRDLVKLEKRPDGKWFADLTRYGTDVAEYTIDCEPGIARPVKYW